MVALDEEEEEERDGAGRGGAIGVPAGERPTGYMPLSSTTGPSTMQMSHTR